MIFGAKRWPSGARAKKLEALHGLISKCSLIFLLATTTSTQLCRCQATDGDEQFQVYHQDIGRISGGASQAQIAPQTVVRQLAAPVTAAPAPLVSQPAASAHGGVRTHARTQHSGDRKPNRITLAVRTPAPALPEQAAPAVPLAAPASAQPRFFSAPAHEPEPGQAPSFSGPQAGHSAAQFAHHQQAFHQPAVLAPAASAQPALAPQQELAPAGPALSSFRSAANSVSARHSALMAQVAAERAAAHAVEASPSLGSPLEALSSPAVAQVQPPPTLQQPAAAANAVSPAFQFSANPSVEEPLVAPSFEHVVTKGCPHKGVFSYENKDHCDRYYMCTNGTFTEEACPNGLAYSQMGAVYQHCAYNWNVDCGRKKSSEPLSSPGCPWQFGIFPAASGGRCSIDYFVCEWGVPETKRCSPEGLFYDDRIKGCQWADQLGCKSEALLNFKCPPEDEDNPYWPFPRYYHTKQDVIVCVNEQPRLVHCNEEQIVDPSSLACLDLKKKKKKF